MIPKVECHRHISPVSPNLQSKENHGGNSEHYAHGGKKVFSEQ